MKSDGQVLASLTKEPVQWSACEAVKFGLLVEEIKMDVDRLQMTIKNIVGVEDQNRKLASKILQIDDQHTLDWIAETCNDVHLQVAIAASTKAGILPEQKVSTMKRQISSVLIVGVMLVSPFLIMLLAHYSGKFSVSISETSKEERSSR